MKNLFLKGDQGVFEGEITLGWGEAPEAISAVMSAEDCKSALTTHQDDVKHAPFCEEVAAMKLLMLLFWEFAIRNKQSPADNKNEQVPIRVTTIDKDEFRVWNIFCGLWLVNEQVFSNFISQLRECTKKSGLRLSYSPRGVGENHDVSFAKNSSNQALVAQESSSAASVEAGATNGGGSILFNIRLFGCVFSLIRLFQAAGSNTEPQDQLRAASVIQGVADKSRPLLGADSSANIVCNNSIPPSTLALASSQEAASLGRGGFPWCTILLDPYLLVVTVLAVAEVGAAATINLWGRQGKLSSLIALGVALVVTLAVVCCGLYYNIQKFKHESIFPDSQGWGR